MAAPPDTVRAPPTVLLEASSTFVIATSPSMVEAPMTQLFVTGGAACDVRSTNDAVSDVDVGRVRQCEHAVDSCVAVAVESAAHVQVLADTGAASYRERALGGAEGVGLGADAGALAQVDPADHGEHASDAGVAAHEEVLSNARAAGDSEAPVSLDVDPVESVTAVWPWSVASLCRMVLPPTYRFWPMPAPPVTISAPEFGVVEPVLEVTARLPCTVASAAMLVMPPTHRFSVMPVPLTTCSAPSVVEVVPLPPIRCASPPTYRLLSTLAPPGPGSEPVSVPVASEVSTARRLPREKCATPTPPSTTSAPLSVALLSVALKRWVRPDTLTLSPAEIVPATTIAPVPMVVVAVVLLRRSARYLRSRCRRELLLDGCAASNSERRGADGRGLRSRRARR